MATRFVVLGSDEDDEDGDLRHGEKEANGGCTVAAGLEPNVWLTTPPTALQSTAAAGRMTAPEATFAVQDATMHDSPASSGKRYSVPASLTSQVIRQELASAHAALLADASPATPSAHHDAAPHSGPSSDHAVIHENRAESPGEDGGPGLDAEACLSLENKHIMFNKPAKKAEPPPNLPSWVQITGKGKVTPQRGLTTYGRLEKVRKAKEHGISEEAEKDVWEFNLLSQDPGMDKALASKGNANKSAPNLKSSRAKRQDPVGNDDREALKISDEEDEQGWSGKEGRKGCKKAAPRKSTTGRRSKTCVVTSIDDGIAGVQPVVYGDDENDDDYSPVGNFRKAKKKVIIDHPISSGRKKTRSNTDDWELMPALPKGRKSTVLKQLAAGFEFESDSMTLKAAAKTRTSTSASTSPLRNNPPLSPFKVDLVRDSLILTEEEKEKYDAFLPTATSPGQDGLLHEDLEELASVKSPQLPSGPQEMVESIPVGAGTDMGSIIVDEEYLDLKHKAGKETSTRDVKESKNISLFSDTPSTGKMKSKLGSRSKTLAELLDMETDKDEEDSGQGIVNLEMYRSGSFQSPIRKRVRLKQASDKTVMGLSPKKLELESSSDQITRQKANILSEVSDSPKPKQPVPKASNRKRSSRYTSKSTFLDEDSTHDEDNLPAAESEAQYKSRRPPVKRRKKSQAEATDANEQAPQPLTLILGDMASNEERSRKADLLPTTATKKNASRAGKVETQHGKGNKNMKYGKGSTKHLDDQDLGAKEGVDDLKPDEHDVGGPSDSRVSTPKGQGIGTGKEKSPPSTPVLREPILTLKQPETPQPAKSAVKQNPHSPINGGKPPPIKFRVGLSRRANIEPLHRYIKK